MTDDRLLVPTHLTAMVASRPEALLTPFIRTPPDYSKLKRFSPIGPQPFAWNEADDPGPGAHLHWLLPRPLRHAPDATQGGAGFPLVPNRWVVVRVPTAGTAKGGGVAAWIVVSDEVSADGASPFVDPTTPAGEIPKPVRMGTSYVLDAKLTSLPDTGAPFLQAVGPGKATFAVWAPGVQSIFAFHDQLDGVPAGTFTYHVAGWYSSGDPLGAVTWSAQGDGSWVDDTFGFTAWTGRTKPPSAMLVHAFLYGVAWDPDGANHPLPSYPQDVPRTVTVAVGNTAIDALAAVVAKDHSPAEGQMLQAFQYGLLDSYDQPASGTVLDRAIRRHWYGAAPGGTVWRVVAIQSGPAALPTPPPAKLTQAQAVLLDALNADQRELDRQARILDSMRWRLSVLWWKHQWMAADRLRRVRGVDRTWLQTQLAVHLGMTTPAAGGVTPYVEQVEAQAAAVDRLTAAVAADGAALDAALDAATQQRKAASLPQYQLATDPTVLVTGLGRATVLDPAEPPACRVASQTVNSIGAKTPAVPALTDPHGLLPPGVQELHTEAVVLSPPPAGKPAPPAPRTRFPPPPAAMAAWSPSWIPLLLDWRVTVLNAPAYSDADTSSPVWTFDQSHWSFDGTDYHWAGPPDPSRFDENASLAMQLEGRTFITPHLPVTLAAQLDEYVKQHRLRDDALEELLTDLDTTLRGVAEQDILSQNLSGLRSLMTQRDPSPTTPPPPGRIADALGPDPQRGFPRPFPSETDLPVWDFAPVAGSFFVIDALTVIDHQGQAVDVTYANHNPQPYAENVDEALGLYPLAAPGVRTPMSMDPPPPDPLPRHVAGRMLQLPPRLAQEAQVRFGLRSADGSDADVTLASQSTPVCGWILPNHLDGSLAVYDAAGNALGELSMSSHPRAGYVPKWTPDPTNADAPASAGAIPNQYVAAMLAALCDRDDDGAGLSDLLLTIDETLWTIEPGSTRTDQDLAVLVGRPLAVVRAELSLVLRGLPVVSQDWWNTFAVDPAKLPHPADQPVALAAVDGGVGELTWSVRLGDAGLRDDGLIGYFVDDPFKPADTWTRLMATSPPAAVKSGYVAQPGTAGTPYVRLRFVDDTVTTLDPAQLEAARLTLLVDPRASVHAFTGLLPVTSLQVPSWYTSTALRAMSYLFRAGPILTPPDELRFPRPSERRGQWSWFDRVGGTAPLAPADQNATLPRTPPRAVEGWLKLTPNPPVEGTST